MSIMDVAKHAHAYFANGVFGKIGARVHARRVARLNDASARDDVRARGVGTPGGARLQA